MRSLIPFCVILALSAPAHAAPTCQTRTGDTIRCGTEGAMPVGWTLPPEERVDRPAIADTAALLKVILGLGLFFAFIALLPQFDGSHAADWDRQEGDEKK
jgi:hypothetical protein